MLRESEWGSIRFQGAMVLKGSSTLLIIWISESGMLVSLLSLISISEVATLAGGEKLKSCAVWKFSMFASCVVKSDGERQYEDLK